MPPTTKHVRRGLAATNSVPMLRPMSASHHNARQRQVPKKKIKVLFNQPVYLNGEEFQVKVVEQIKGELVRVTATSRLSSSLAPLYLNYSDAMTSIFTSPDVKAKLKAMLYEDNGHLKVRQDFKELFSNLA